MSVFDDQDLQEAMRTFLWACDNLDDAAASDTRDEDQAKVLLDLAEAKAMAGLSLRRRLTELGWVDTHRSSAHSDSA